ncbi:MAG: AAA family ATPase [Deferribacteres bacterium]|nr:AAA family ATPase [Deferribacteres bacterium]
MYNEYFGFQESPFSIAPDPRYLYMSEQHREALAHLVYGLNSDGGFVLLTGEVGTGKTTVCRCLLEQLPENTAVAFIFNPKLTVEELLATVCDEFGIRYPEGNTSIKVFTDLINAFLLDVHAGGRKAVLIIDEAQNLSIDVLEQLRLLTNLETNRHKLLQIILLGQPELREQLSRPALRQLSQRITARYHLGALSRNDIGAYVTHRLSVAGLRKKLFTDSSIRKLFYLSGGIPRLINILCDRALLGAFAGEKNRVNKGLVKKAAREVLGEGRGHSSRVTPYVWVMSVLILAVLGVVLSAAYYKKNIPRETATGNKTGILNAVVNSENKPVQTATPRWPEIGPRDRVSTAAFAELFRLWGISYDPGEEISPCRQAESQGLQCLRGPGSLNDLRRLDRPAVLKLFDDQGGEYYAALTGLKTETATLVTARGTREVAVRDIEARWLGDYTLLWRTPPDYRGELMPGKSDHLVRWINRELATVQGRPFQPLEDTEFSGSLVTNVKKFQLSRGLVPDGIVGPRTLIHLNTAAGIDTPKLSSGTEEN